MNVIGNELITLSNNNKGFYKQNVKKFILNTLLKTKIQHIAWHIFHSFSVRYPSAPTDEQKTRTKNFIKKITTNLGIVCSSCGGSKDTFISSKTDAELDSAVGSNSNLIEFFINYHKYVNTTLRKQANFAYDCSVFTTSNISDKYTNTNYIVYGIDLLDLCNNNKMDSFFLLFQKNVKEYISYTESTNYPYDFDITFLRVMI